MRMLVINKQLTADAGEREGTESSTVCETATRCSHYDSFEELSQKVKNQNIL